MSKNEITKYNKHDSASHRCFGQFVRYICEEVISEYGASYETQGEIRNKWRDTYKYSPAIEKFLIRRAKLFIATLDVHNPDNSNLGFLHAVINEMADYLSRYTMRKKNGMLRKDARGELQKVLWDENAHIKALKSTQEDNRFAKKSPKYAAKKRKQERRERAKQDWDIAQQVKYDIFIEASYLRRK